MAGPRADGGRPARLPEQRPRTAAGRRDRAGVPVRRRLLEPDHRVPRRGRADLERDRLRDRTLRLPDDRRGRWARRRPPPAVPAAARSPGPPTTGAQVVTGPSGTPGPGRGGRTAPSATPSPARSPSPAAAASRSSRAARSTGPPPPERTSSPARSGTPGAGRAGRSGRWATPSPVRSPSPAAAASRSSRADHLLDPRHRSPRRHRRHPGRLGPDRLGERTSAPPHRRDRPRPRRPLPEVPGRLDLLVPHHRGTPRRRRHRRHLGHHRLGERAPRLPPHRRDPARPRRPAPEVPGRVRLLVAHHRGPRRPRRHPRRLGRAGLGERPARLPTTGERFTGGVRRQDFQGGFITVDAAPVQLRITYR